MNEAFGSTLDRIILFIILISIGYQIFYFEFFIKKYGHPIHGFKNLNEETLEKKQPEKKGIYKSWIKKGVDKF